MSTFEQKKADAVSPWHRGELIVQRKAGVVAHMDSFGRQYVRTFMPEQHRDFFPLLPFVLIGSVDKGGNIWATMRAGKPGFLSSQDEHHLTVNTMRDSFDPADEGMEDGDSIGLLGIDLMSRRRNRLNGVIKRTESGSHFSIKVDQSFGACPRYITNRSCLPTRAADQQSPKAPYVVNSIDDKARQMIMHADSFFVASYIDGNDSRDGVRQVDVSHRGGKPGFVRVDEDGGLTIPEFNGNLFFNTLGNFVLNPKAGMLFVDYASGDMLQMTGEAVVVLDSPEIAAFQGAERMWRFMPRVVVHRPLGLPLRWDSKQDGSSPSVFMTGNWDEAAARLKATSLAGKWRPFRVVEVIDESKSVRSLVLEPADGAAMVPHLPGQHLPVRMLEALDVEDSARLPSRSYTLSTAPSDKLYRISVKREGLISHKLHKLQVGEMLEARAPAGSFTIDATQRRTAVLLAAGIGITPILSMLRHLVHEGVRTGHQRPVWIFQSARNKEERVFDGEIDALVEAAHGRIQRVRVLSSPKGAEPGKDYDAIGRIDLDLLCAQLPLADYDFYLCGPASFMQSLYDGLRTINISDDRIHAEAFGQSGIKRTVSEGAKDRLALAPSTVSVPMIFSTLSKEVMWKPGDGSILKVAEEQGLSPAYGCRSGSCGTCRVKILEGQVAYLQRPTVAVGSDEALICCAVPAMTKPSDTVSKLVLQL